MTTPNNPAGPDPEARFRRETDRQSQQLAQTEQEIATLRSASDAAQTGGKATAAEPPAAIPSESVEAAAARLVAQRTNENAFAQALVNLTTDAETAALVLQAKGAVVEFADGVPKFRIGSELVDVTRESLAQIGVSKVLITSPGHSGSGGHATDEIIAGPTLDVVTRGNQDFRFFKENRAAIFRAKFGQEPLR